MTTNPVDFGSYAFGCALKSANYSGGAGGTFTDLKTGNQDWTVNSATPTFATRAGLEGVKFSAAAGERINAQLYAVGEATMVAILMPDTTGSMYAVGGANTVSNEPAIQTSGGNSQAFTAYGNSGLVGGSYVIPIVMAASFSNETGICYMTTYDGTLRKGSGASTRALMSHHEISIGSMRTTYFNGWIGEVHGFHKALHVRNEAALDDMILTLAAKVGL